MLSKNIYFRFFTLDIHGEIWQVRGADFKLWMDFLQTPPKIIVNNNCDDLNILAPQQWDHYLLTYSKESCPDLVCLDINGTEDITRIPSEEIETIKKYAFDNDQSMNQRLINVRNTFCLYLHDNGDYAACSTDENPVNFWIRILEILFLSTSDYRIDKTSVKWDEMMHILKQGFSISKYSINKHTKSLVLRLKIHDTTQRTFKEKHNTINIPLQIMK